MARRDLIDEYVGRLAAHLLVGPTERRNILIEVEDHLRSAVAGHVQEGLNPDMAQALVLEEFGPPAELARSFGRRRAFPGLWLCCTLLAVVFGLVLPHWVLGFQGPDPLQRPWFLAGLWALAATTLVLLALPLALSLVLRRGGRGLWALGEAALAFAVGATTAVALRSDGHGGILHFGGGRSAYATILVAVGFAAAWRRARLVPDWLLVLFAGSYAFAAAGDLFSGDVRDIYLKAWAVPVLVSAVVCSLPELAAWRAARPTVLRGPVSAGR